MALGFYSDSSADEELAEDLFYYMGVALAAQYGGLICLNGPGRSLGGAVNHLENDCPETSGL